MNYVIAIKCKKCGCDSLVIAGDIPDSTHPRKPIHASALCFHCDADIYTKFKSFAAFKKDPRVIPRPAPPAGGRIGG